MSLTVGERIGQIAKEKKINLHQLSKMVDIPYNTLYSFVKRKSDKVNFESLLKIADALDVKIDELYDPEEVKKVEGIVDRTWEIVRGFYGIDENDQIVVSLLGSYNLMNLEGKLEAERIVNIIAGNPKYQAQKPSEAIPEDK